MEKKSLLRKLMKIEYFTRKLPKHKVNWILHWYSNPGVLTREKPAFTQEWVLRHGGIEWAKIFLKSILIMLTLVLSLNMYFNTTPSFPYSIWKQFPVHHFELKLLQIRIWERKQRFVMGEGEMGAQGAAPSLAAPNCWGLEMHDKTQGSASLQPPVLHKWKGQQIVTLLTVHDLFNFDFFLDYKVNESLCCTSVQTDFTVPLFTNFSHKATLITLTGQ